MTAMLASVRSLAEARIVLSAGVDLVDLKEPAAGALGALAVRSVRRIVRFVNGRTPVSATVGDLPCEAGPLDDAIARTAACGVDLIKVGIFAGHLDDRALRAIGQHCASGRRIVLVFFAEFWSDGADFRRIRRAGVEGVMLDTVDKQRGPLTRSVRRQVLQSFVSGARQAGLLAGLAGSLREADIGRLLPLQPDYLGFRGALCAGGRRGGKIDPRAVCAIRNLLRGGMAAAGRGPARTAA